MAIEDLGNQEILKIQNFSEHKEKDKNSEDIRMVRSYLDFLERMALKNDNVIDIREYLENFLRAQIALPGEFKMSRETFDHLNEIQDVFYNFVSAEFLAAIKVSHPEWAKEVKFDWNKNERDQQFYGKYKPKDLIVFLALKIVSSENFEKMVLDLTKMSAKTHELTTHDLIIRAAKGDVYVFAQQLTYCQLIWNRLEGFDEVVIKAEKELGERIEEAREKLEERDLLDALAMLNILKEKDAKVTELGLEITQKLEKFREEKTNPMPIERNY